MGSNMVLKTVSTLGGGGGGGGGGGTPGGANSTIQFNNAGAFAGSANLTWDGANVQVGSSGSVKFSNGVNNYVAFKAPTLISSNVTWTLPNTDGLPDQVLITNGFGVLSWATPNLTPTAPTNNTLPIVTGPPGTPTVGQTFQSTTGTWSGYPAPSFAYQWIRGAATNVGTNSPSYQLVDADLATTVKCRVTATNTAGSANATSAATATIVAGAPQPPTGVTAVPGNAEATVSFTAPAITGGSTITSYTVTSNPGSFTSSGLSLSQTVTGLTNGVSYTFTVTATNAIGTSDPSAASTPVTPSTTFSVEYLVLAGGGGGGYSAGGGGGAGGYLTSTLSAAISTAYTVTVGNGGSGGVGSTVAGTGFNSVFASITSTGGGGGGSSGVAPTSGGSGGGAGNAGAFIGGAPASPSGQGNGGGNNNGGSPYPTGGGGGAGPSAVGGTGVITSPGVSAISGSGGAGAESSITGTPVTRGGGGGGSATNQGAAAGSGGAGGGGNGGTVGSPNGAPGDENLGGGGGGACNSGTPSGGAGGRGVVIIKIPDTRTASFTGGVTWAISTAVSGFKIYTVTATSSTSETVTFS